MTTLLIDLVLVFWLLLFGAMALLPIITGTTADRHHARPDEDRVIHIEPARPGLAPQPGQRSPLVPHDDRDQHDRPAA